MSATCESYPLETLATLAADDLSKVCVDRSANVDGARELVRRLRIAAIPISPPSETSPVLNALRLSTRGGTDASAEAMRDFSAAMAERIVLAVVAQPPEDEYRQLIGFCLRVADNSQVAARRAAPQIARPQVV